MIEHATQTRCTNCGADLQSRWCGACGQKRIVHADRRLGVLLGDALREVTSLDGRFLRSLGALMFRPGHLGREWLDGRRARWMSPMALFLLANVLYFLAPGLSDFNLPFSDHVDGRMILELHDDPSRLSAEDRERIAANRGQRHTEWTSLQVQRRVAARDAASRAQSGPGYTLRDQERDYDAQAGNVGKTLIIAHVPILAFVLMLVFWNRGLFFAEHLVIALHVFTFLLLFVELVVLPGGLLAQAIGIAPNGIPPWARTVSAIILVAYFLRTFMVAYRSRWWHAAIGVVAWVVGLAIANLWFYRTLQFLITFAIT